MVGMISSTASEGGNDTKVIELARNSKILNSDIAGFTSSCTCLRNCSPFVQVTFFADVVLQIKHLLIVLGHSCYQMICNLNWSIGLSPANIVLKNYNR